MLKSTNGLRDSSWDTFIKSSFTMFCIAFLIASSSCSSTRYARVQKESEIRLRNSDFGYHHSGLLVLDPHKQDTLINVSGSRYFIPASNVKIATLYTALKFLPEKLPVIKYTQISDTVYFEGLGYPASLHPYFRDSTLVRFLASFESVRLKDPDPDIPEWPSGWSWEDFDQPFAAERSSLPLYGNSLVVHLQDSLAVRPLYFKDSISSLSSRFHRERTKNLFYYSESKADSLVVPFHMSEGLIKDLLEVELDKEIEIFQTFPAGDQKVLFGISRDTVLRYMMLESDNFLAEQLLLQASSTLTDSLNSKKVIDHIVENELPDFIRPPRWVDGSGLSRYNLFSPESLVHLLDTMYEELGEEYLLNFFPAGGVSGTLEDDFAGIPEPYIFAKSGSMGNIYCLSGFLRSSSGKLLIFSFMNNNFTDSQSEIREEMNTILSWIRDMN